MEVAGSAVLTPQQKQQLKEKLAVLKREYNKTFHRLQRAERAAKVKNHVKETIAQQKLLLGQEEAVKNHAGGLSQLSPEGPEEGQAGISCPGSTAETTPVLFKSGAFEGSLPETSCSRRTRQAGRRVLFNSMEPPLGSKCSLRSPSRTTGQQREMPTLAEREEMREGEHQRATNPGSESPGAKSSGSLLDAGQSSPQASGPGGSGDASPEMSDPDSEELTQTDIPGVMQALPSFQLDASPGSFLDPLSEEGLSGLEDSAAVSCVWNGEKEEEQPGWGGKEGPGWLAEPAVTPDAAQGDRTFPDRHREDVDNGDPPSEETSGEDKGHSLEVGLPPLGGPSPRKQGLGSCTMVEGLMFPLEYYVRVTRRLSRRPQEVNLEGVMQSHLGKGGKGWRGAPKEQAANRAQPSQELSSAPRVPGGASGSSPPSPKRTGSSRGCSRGRRNLRLRRRTQKRTSSSTDGGRSPPAGSPAPASPGLWRELNSAAAALPLSPLGGEGSHLGWLPPSLPHQDFHLPDEDFGHLKSKKLQVRPEKLLGVWDAGGSSEGPPSPGEAPLQEGAASGPSRLSRRRGTPPALFSRELLLSPALDGGQSLVQSPDFPLLGATPAALVSPDPSGGPPSQAAAAGPADPEGGRGQPRSPPGPAGISRRARGEAASPSEKPLEGDKEPPRQSRPAEEVRGAAPAGTPREGSLRMTSKLKDGSGSCLVDMSAVWWEAADFAELCVVTAEETSVSLWRPLHLGRWGTVHTWHFAKFPVIQIVALSGAHSVVGAVLGRLETAEIRLLFHSSEESCAKELLLKAGNINAVLGLTDRKLVSSCWSLRGQEVEAFSFSEAGRSHKRWALMPPEETVLAFADVAGLQEALLGMTAMNCIVLWNLGTGQLLKKIPVGWSFPASVCHKAYSDAGLLFLVFSHPDAKDSQLPGKPAFQIVALNPKTARSSGVMLLALPPSIQGRYLERDVRGTSAAAVLTSGTIAVWDLFLGQCTALLPPNSGGSWSLARWSVTDTCLLAGQEDGSVYVYEYTGGLHSG